MFFFIRYALIWSVARGFETITLTHYRLVASDTMRHHGSLSTLVQVMAFCLTAQSHYLNQCSLVIWTCWNKPYASFKRNTTIFNKQMHFKMLAKCRPHCLSLKINLVLRAKPHRCHIQWMYISGCKCLKFDFTKVIVGSVNGWAPYRLQVNNWTKEHQVEQKPLA